MRRFYYHSTPEEENRYTDYKCIYSGEWIMQNDEVYKVDGDNRGDYVKKEYIKEYVEEMAEDGMIDIVDSIEDYIIDELPRPIYGAEIL